MTNHETTTNFQDERVGYQDWLRQPVFKASWWSPAGAHVEALVQINQGGRVSKEVIKAIGEIGGSDERILEMINDWNAYLKYKKEKKGLVSDEDLLSQNILLSRKIIYTFENDGLKNKKFEQICPSRMTAIDGKKEILGTAVQLRSGALKS